MTADGLAKEELYLPVHTPEILVSPRFNLFPELGIDSEGKGLFVWASH